MQVVMDQPRRQAFRLRRGLAALSGSLLILVGLSAVPAVVVLAVLSRGERTRTSSTVGSGTVVGVLVAVAVVTLILPAIGVRLVRGSRRLVVFLRRFGYDEATYAVTFAAMRTIGRSWRLVTLDDAAVAPVGVSVPTARLFAAGRGGSRWIGRAWRSAVRAALWVFTLAVAGMAAVAVFVLIHDGSLGRLSGALDSRGSTHADAVGVFRVLFVVTVIAAVTMLGVAIVAVPATALVGPYVFLGMAARSLRDAEHAKVTRVTTVEGAHAVAVSLHRRAGRVFSPRLFVVNVDADVWRPTVVSLAAQAAVVLIDVSEPTVNLLWEIENVTRESPPRCVLVASRDRLDQLRAPADGSVAQRLVPLLAGRTVLAYEADRKGMRRFARALRSMLEAA